MGKTFAGVMADIRRDGLLKYGPSSALADLEAAHAEALQSEKARAELYKEADESMQEEVGRLHALLYDEKARADARGHEQTLRAALEFVSKFTSGNSVMRDVRAIAVRAGPTIAQEATSLRDQINAALAAHGKGVIDGT